MGSGKILKIQNIIAATALLTLFLFFMGTAAAADNSITYDLKENHTNYTNSNLTNVSNNSTSTNSTVIKKTQENANNEESSGCCSVLVHVKKGVDVFSYRRDSTYAANLYIQKIKWYGKEAIKEHKNTNGYFFHTIITKNGWIISTGGPDIVWINKKLESLAGKITIKKRITKTDIKSAYKLLKKAKLGHFLIKDPAGNVGLAIYYYGYSKIKVFKMKEREYISVPNNPRYYRHGFITKKSNPVSSAIYLAGTDRYGINRRNIITYKVENINTSTKIKVWASYDGGKLIKRRGRGKPDNIIFRGHKISAKSLPRIPSKRYIGEVKLRSYTKPAVATVKTATAKI
jgi:hypothetical protein